jgi:hypothetical protein
MRRKRALAQGSMHERYSGTIGTLPHANRVLSAVSAANEQLLVTLRASAFRNQRSFPLPAAVRQRFIEVPRAKLRDAASCGVLLVDARCAQIAYERSITPEGREPARYSDTDGGVRHSVALAYSLLAVVWYVVHTTPAAAGLLLGMSASIVERLRDLSVGKLGFVARREPGWVQPRWRERPDVWMGLLETRDAGESPPPSIVLRCLKASSADSDRLRTWIEAGS